MIAIPGCAWREYRVIMQCKQQLRSLPCDDQPGEELSKKKKGIIVAQCRIAHVPI